jgi:hypothetical protein
VIYQTLYREKLQVAPKFKRHLSSKAKLPPRGIGAGYPKFCSYKIHYAELQAFAAILGRVGRGRYVRHSTALKGQGVSHSY